MPSKKMLIILAYFGALPFIFAPLPMETSHQADLKEAGLTLRLAIPGSGEKHPIIDTYLQGIPSRELYDTKSVIAKCGTDESSLPKATTRTPHHLTSTDNLDLELTLTPGRRRKNVDSNAARKRVCSHTKNFSLDNVIHSARLEKISTQPDPSQLMNSPEMQQRTNPMEIAHQDSSGAPWLTLGRGMSVHPDDWAHSPGRLQSTQDILNKMARNYAIRSWLTLGHQPPALDTRNEQHQISDAKAPVRANRRRWSEANPNRISRSTLTDSSKISLHHSNVDHREVQPGISEGYTHRKFNALDHNGPSVQWSKPDSQDPSFKPIRLNQASSLSRPEKLSLVSRTNSKDKGTITGKSLEGRDLMEPATQSLHMTFDKNRMLEPRYGDDFEYQRYLIKTLREPLSEEISRGLIKN
ncbi:uncharacterized protein MELLADRAFT_113305 [Melampsora larici-populina 98AG31]|uniref:Secreted protein n=1 Tax=Melampsora larici-populina (strain 98AG31 / pathotype 3-4-7) TaxID=747676 RepID=F4S9F3_MELLP|nr:uncharacterized protein MELLADRAFT_113305 [Melampsora larici-populina 98AG31]EGF98739.1 hypothetical protein MELLADRAFT_113305 [Melampsora larici-populina 98AG31]